MKEPFIPFALPDFSEDEVSEVADAIRSGWVTTGPRTEKFEAQFREYAKVSHALAVNSCTAGLHLALTALGIGPGDEVITTPITFCATINTILQVGAIPVLADVGHDLNIDFGAIARALTGRTRAILPVHIGGLPCDMSEIWRIAREHDLRVIEDAAHAAGAVYRGLPIGSGPSDAVSFSFYATKNLSTGEGGMVTTSDSALYDRMKVLCLHGISRDAWNRYTEKGNWFYEVVDCGFKYNMSDIMAAIGIHQLRRLDQMNERRAEIARRYNAAFSELPQLELPPDRAECRHAWHLYIIRLNLDRLVIDRASFIDEMRSRGIGCSVHFIPALLQPYYKKAIELRDPCRKALIEYPRLVSLPLYSKMTDAEVERVIEAVRDVTVANSARPFVVAGGEGSSEAEAVN